MIVAYGNFHQFVAARGNGHVSVCIERGADPIALGERIIALVAA